MNKIIKKLILLILFAACCATLLLTWSNVQNVQMLDGTSVLTGNLLLTLLIFGTYGMSVLFYEKAPQTFFCMGFSSLSMFFALMLSKFENLGRFANKCVGPYVGLLSVALTMIVYVFLNIKSKKTNK